MFVPVAAQRAEDYVGPSALFLILPANRYIFSMGLPGLEPGTSSLSEKHDVLLEVSRVFKIPANQAIICITLFPSFQDIGLGCGTH